MPAEPQFKFSEGGEPWRTVPGWVDWMLDIGYVLWPTDANQSRRIALISMPCDSAVAGLLTLGAMIRGLCLQDTNELGLHVEALFKHAEQYLKHCKACELPTCNPEIKNCGYVNKADGRIKLTGTPYIYTISEKSDFEARIIACKRGELTILKQGGSIASLHLYGTPPPKLAVSFDQLPPAPYRLAINGTTILTENLKKSYSGLCLAGRIGGESAARGCMKGIRFKDDVAEYGLDELLSIHGWSSAQVSRVSYFNTRTGDVDRFLAPPKLLVADGDTAFLKAVCTPKFQGSDIVGVINRAADRDSLESLGNKIQQLYQWYEDDEEIMEMLPSAPRGIGIRIMRRKCA